MDALVYEDSPLGDYFEGDAVPVEGDNNSDDSTPEQQSFAPQGLPKFTDRLRRIRRTATTIQPESSEQILEQFRYIIVASQLLADESPTREVQHGNKERDTSLLHGAVATAVFSFATAWALHWLRHRPSSGRELSWVELATYCLAAFCSGVAVLLWSRRQYSKYVQRIAATSLTRLVNDSHTFDTSAGRILRFIQEIELVGRGYELSSPLPPVSRLEDKNTIRRCQNLRSELVKTLTLLITLYVESHNVLQQFVAQQDLTRYHDIYEVSLTEYSDAIKVANELTEDAKSSLKELRFALRLHTVARKVLLCDLLALRTSNGWHRVRQWRSVLSIIRDLEEETCFRQDILNKLIHDIEFGMDAGRSQEHQKSCETPSPLSRMLESPRHKMQLRRFDDVSHGIRALNAKLHVLQEELSGLKSANTDESVVSAVLSKHYEALGTDIRALQVDWERGRNSMLLNVGADHRSRPGSLSPRTPMSPSPSLGGLTIVDGGPAEALRLLNGDDRSSRSSDATLYDDEIFEAVSKPLPRKRMSLGGNMTREEKIAKLNEDRRKRATMQEQADTTTNMMRELQMVIKHRPHQRSPSTPTGPRISSL